MRCTTRAGFSRQRLLDGTTYEAPLELEPELEPMFGQFAELCGAVVLGAVVLGVVVLGVVVVPEPEAAYATPPPTDIAATIAASAV